MKLRVDYLVVGTGPAGLLHNINLRNRGKEVLNVGTNLYGQLRPQKIDRINRSINLLPIFPVVDSELWHSMNLGSASYKTLSLKKVNHNGFHSNVNYRKNSYTEYLFKKKKKYKIPYILSYKQFGNLIFDHSLSELKQKLNRNYKSGQPKHIKTGFKNGLSPYYNFLMSQEPYSVAREAVRNIDIEKKAVTTDKSTIEFNKLIFTLPLTKIFEFTNIQQNFDIICGDAKFYTYYSRKKLYSNHLYYDCNIDTNIYRLFIPQENIVVVQLARNSWNIEPNGIGKEAANLMNLEHSLQHVHTNSYRKCYPLDVTDSNEKERLIAGLEKKDVYLSGRFGRWKYIDLHEVDYEIHKN